MNDKIKLVSERDEKEIAAPRARSELELAIRDFAANVLRIIAGAGDSGRLLNQLVPVIEAHKKLLELTGNTFASEISIGQALRSLDWSADDPRWQWDTALIDRAQNEIVRAALRILAAELCDQRRQKAQAETKMLEPIDRYKLRREELRQA